MVAALREGVTAMMAAQGSVSWTDDGRWHLMAVVDDKGVGHSIVVGAFNVGDDGRLRGHDKAARAKRNTQTQQSNEGGDGIRTPSNAF